MRPWTPAAEWPLAGVRILSMEQAVALPAGTKQLADLGADVIRVASHKRSVTGGSDLRKKRQLAIDLAAPGGPDVFRRVAANVDVVAHNFTPRVIRRFGLEYEAIKAVNPDVIYLSHTGFGMSGPWSERPLFGPGAEAMSGHNQLIGEPDAWPGRPGFAGYVDNTGGLNVSYAILAALEERDRTGRGQHIDLCLYEAAVSHLGPVIAERAFGSPMPLRMGNRDLNYAVHNVFSARGLDREVAIAVRHDQAEALKAALDLPEATDDAVSTRVREMVAENVVAKLQAAGIAAHVVSDASDVTKDEHLWARGYFGVTNDAPHGGQPWGGGAATTGGDTRTVGADTRAVLAEVGGYSEAEIEALMADETVGEPAPNATPGQGFGRPANPDRIAIALDRGEISRVDAVFDTWKQVSADAEAALAAEPQTTAPQTPIRPEENARPRCLDLGGGVGASYAAKILADAGWDVVKVEPSGGDATRKAQSRWSGGEGGAFAFLNQGKRSITVKDRAELEGLARSADIVVGNFSAEGCAAMGLDRADFEALAPGRVMLSVSPFGLTGPKADWAATEITTQAATGMMFITGAWEQQPMQLPPYATALMGGIAGAAAAVAGLRLARRDGFVRRVDVSQVEAMVGHSPWNGYSRNGEVRRREPRIPPSLHHAPTSDGFIFCADGPIQQTNMMSTALLLNEPLLTDERFQSAEGRMANWDEFVSIFVPPFATRTSAEWFADAEALHMTFALVQTVDDLAACPQLNSRGFFRPMPGPDGREFALPGRAFVCEDGPETSIAPAPATPGQDSNSVRRDWLG